MRSRINPMLDIAVALFLISVALAFLWELRDIPPGVFEPLGSGPVPQVTATIVILLCLVVLIRAGIRIRRNDAAPLPALAGDSENDTAPENPLAVIAAGILTVAYVIALTAQIAGFALTTAVFLFVLISILARFERRALVIATIIAVVMGYGCQYIFTEIFVVDLPSSRT